MITDIFVKCRGIRFACTFDDEGEMTAKPDADTAEAECLALDIENEWAYYKLTNAEPLGFVSPADELVDWLRVNYGDDAVTFKEERGDGGRVY